MIGRMAAATGLLPLFLNRTGCLLRFIQDRNYQRMYMIFGGGNRNWRTIFMDGREQAVVCA